MSSDLLALGAAILLLLVNAFFVGAEFALISARRDRLEAMARAGTPGASTVLRAIPTTEIPARSSMVLAASQNAALSSTIRQRIGTPRNGTLVELRRSPPGRALPLAGTFTPVDRRVDTR